MVELRQASHSRDHRRFAFKTQWSLPRSMLKPYSKRRSRLAIDPLPLHHVVVVVP